MPGFDVFGGDKDLMDRERLGDSAIRAGVKYLAITIPLSSLSDALASPYLPPQTSEQGIRPQVLEPVGKDKFGQDVSLRLTANIEDFRISGNPSFNKPEHKVLILYSPRIFSLNPWMYGNAVLLNRPVNQNEPGQLCRGWSCVTSNSPEVSRKQAFEDMANSDDMAWQVRADGPLPRYEIMGIVVSSDDASNVATLFKTYPGLASWESKVFQNSYPKLEPKYRTYSPEQLYEVALDINPMIERRTADHGDANVTSFVLSNSVTKFTADFPGTVRAVIANRAMPNLHAALKEKDINYGWAGYSKYEVDMMQSMSRVLTRGGTAEEQNIPKLLPGATLHRATHIEVHTIKKWEFILAEYEGKNDQKRLVLFIANDGGGPPAGVPYQVWGIAKYADSETLEWEWIPEN